MCVRACVVCVCVCVCVRACMCAILFCCFCSSHQIAFLFCYKCFQITIMYTKTINKKKKKKKKKKKEEKIEKKENVFSLHYAIILYIFPCSGLALHKCKDSTRHLLQIIQHRK